MVVQRLGWTLIFLILSTASAHDTYPETSSESLTKATLTTVNFEDSENVTNGIPVNVPTDLKSDIKPELSFMPEMADKIQEESKIVHSSPEVSPKNPASMPLKSNQETSAIDEMTVTYESTTVNLRDSLPDEIPSTTSNSEKKLYYDDGTTTEYGISREMSAESPDIIFDENVYETTPSMELVGEKAKVSHTDDLLVLINSPVGNNTADGKILTNGSNEMTEKEITALHGAESSIHSIISKSSLSENEPKMEKVDSSITVKAEDTNYSDNHEDQNKISKVSPNTHDQTTISSLEKVTSKNDETSFVFMDNDELAKDLKEVISEMSTMHTEISSDKNISLTDIITADINDYNIDNMSVDATEINSNSTRNPKTFQSEGRYPEGRIRPIHPDPGYAKPEPDRVRPYRPDSPLHMYPYYRPTPDYRTPVIKDDKDFTRPSRPDPEYQRVSFKPPNYSYSKTSQDSTTSNPSSSSEASGKPYRPSFSRPYHSQSSFGRPYRPDYHRPASSSIDDYSVTQKSTTEIKSISSQDAEVSEHSRADYDFTRLSETLPLFTKTYQPDSRPSQLKPDITKPYRPTYGSESSMHSKPTSLDDPFNENRDSTKVSKPDMDSSRPSSLYPRPGFGNNYQTSDTSNKPFSVGTVTSAKNLTRVEFIKADCFDNHMKVTMRFNGTFNGLVYSSGYAQDSSCSYVNGSGRNHYEFFIRLNRCGTLGQQEVADQRLRAISRRRQERAQYLVNTVTVQYNPVIEEDIDEHFRVTCEYGYDFWKTVTFPIINVESSAVKVRTGSPVVFTLPPPQCNMEIRSGFGPSGTRVSGPVNVGDSLTLVIHMKSESSGFDILVSNCFAHNGAQKRLQLIDSNGCVVQEQIVSPFRGVSSPDRTQTVTLYSYLKAFRFTGSPALYIECDVHMCHGSCPPQRCYWRHLYKRSAEEQPNKEAVTTPDNLRISESISLFQALEVRHDEVDSPNLLALRNFHGYEADDMMCVRTGGFAAMLACLLLLLVGTTFAAVCMCLRMRKMKRFVEEASDTKHFVEFDGHVPFK